MCTHIPDPMVPFINSDSDRSPYSSRGGNHTGICTIDISYPDAATLLADLNKSPLFVISRPPFRHGLSIVYDYIPTRIGPNGMFITVRTSKISAGAYMAHKRDLVYDDSGNELTCSVEIRYNPKVLGGVADYITPANHESVCAFVDEFNRICAEISPVLLNLSCYRFKRSDPCINILLHDIMKIHDAEKKSGRYLSPLHIIALVKMGDVPQWFRVYHPPTGDEKSAYMTTKTVNINFYCKGEEMKEKYPDVAGIELASDIVRLEVQMLQNKMYQLFKNNRSWEELQSYLFDEDWNVQIVSRYWWRVVGHGDWYSLREAEARVRSMHLRSDKEQRLISALQMISRAGSVHAAKSRVSGWDKRELVNSLSELRDLGINGACIPDEWGIKWIPNVLEAWLEQSGYSLQDGTRLASASCQTPVDRQLDGRVPSDDAYTRGDG